MAGVAGSLSGAGDRMSSIKRPLERSSEGVLFILPLDDHNQFFSTRPGTHLYRAIERIASLAKKVLRVRVHSVERMAAMIRTYAPSINTVVLCGHGTQKTLQFGPEDRDPSVSMLTTENVTLDLFRPLSERKIKVLLFSCTTGKGGADSLAHRIAEVAKIPVVAPTEMIYSSSHAVNPLFCRQPNAFPFCMNSSLKFEFGKKEEPIPDLKDHFFDRPLFPRLLESLTAGGFDKEAELGSLALLRAGKTDKTRLEEAFAVAKTLCNPFTKRKVAAHFEREGFTDYALELYSRVGDADADMEIALILIKRGEYLRADAAISKRTEFRVLDRVADAYFDAKEEERAKKLVLRMNNKLDLVLVAKKWMERGAQDFVEEIVTRRGELRCALEFCQQYTRDLHFYDRLYAVAGRILTEDERKILIISMLRCATFREGYRSVPIREGFKALLESITREDALLEIILVQLSFGKYTEGLSLCDRLTDLNHVLKIVQELVWHGIQTDAVRLARRLETPLFDMRLVNWLIEKRYFTELKMLVDDKKINGLTGYVARRLHSGGYTSRSRDYVRLLPRSMQREFEKDGVFRKRKVLLRGSSSSSSSSSMASQMVGAASGAVEGASPAAAGWLGSEPSEAGRKRPRPEEEEHPRELRGRMTVG